MRFGHLELFVRDVVRARAFYRDVLGFEVTVEAGGLVWLRHGNTEFLLRPGRPADPAGRYQDAAAGFVLYTDDLERTAGRLESRGLIFKGIVDSDKCLTFSDPDGNWFQLVNPADH